MTRERFEQILFAHVSDEVVQDMLNQYVLELESSNAKLFELVRDMLPFAEVGFEDTCPTRRCCLFVECDAMSDAMSDVMSDCKCCIEEHMSQRLHDLGVEVNG